MATLLVHSIVFTYFLGTGKWVKEVVRVYGLPDWVRCAGGAEQAAGVPVRDGGHDARRGDGLAGRGGGHAAGWRSAWHLGVAAVALAFNLGAFAVEYAAIVAQARLLLEVKDQADRLREARRAELAGGRGRWIAPEARRIARCRRWWSSS